MPGHKVTRSKGHKVTRSLTTYQALTGPPLMAAIMNLRRLMDFKAGQSSWPPDASLAEDRGRLMAVSMTTGRTSLRTH